MKQRDIKYYTTESLTRIQQFALSIWTAIYGHLRRVRPAFLGIALFLSVVFAFAIKGELAGQAAQTALLPPAPADTVATAAAAADTAAVEAPSYVVGEKLERMEPLPPQQIDTETLWLARVIYSETKKPQEQELVAWVVRNRVETAYRGKSTYQSVALDPYQFSAFNPGTRTRSHYANLTASSTEPGFKNAVAIAHQVKNAPDSLRPFSETTRHFFSEQSMAGGRHPNWSYGKEPVTPERPFDLNERRFRFYANVG